MKRIALAVMFGCFAVILLTIMSSCRMSQQVDDPEMAQFRRVAGDSNSNIYVVTIDGVDYIVVFYGGSGTAICPKVTANK